YTACPACHSAPISWWTSSGTAPAIMPAMRTPSTAARSAAAGGSGRWASGRVMSTGSVPAQEQVRPPRLVALIGEVRREERVDVAARLERRPVEAGPRLLDRPAPPSGGGRPARP